MKYSRCQHENLVVMKCCGQCAAPLCAARVTRFWGPDSYRHSESARILSSHSLWVVYLGEAYPREGGPAEARGRALCARDLARVRASAASRTRRPGCSARSSRARARVPTRWSPTARP
jgi:hypothetical protein